MWRARPAQALSGPSVSKAARKPLSREALGMIRSVLPSAGTWLAPFTRPYPPHSLRVLASRSARHNSARPSRGALFGRTQSYSPIGLIAMELEHRPFQPPTTLASSPAARGLLEVVVCVAGCERRRRCWEM